MFHSTTELPPVIAKFIPTFVAALSTLWNANLSLPERDWLQLDVSEFKRAPFSGFISLAVHHIRKSQVVDVWASVNQSNVFALLCSEALNKSIPNITIADQVVAATAGNCPTCMVCNGGVPMRPPAGDFDTECGYPTRGNCACSNHINICICNPGFAGEFCSVAPSPVPHVSPQTNLRELSLVVGLISTALTIVYTVYSARKQLKGRLRHRFADKGLPLDWRDWFTIHIMCATHPGVSRPVEHSNPLLIGAKTKDVKSQRPNSNTGTDHCPNEHYEQWYESCEHYRLDKNDDEAEVQRTKPFGARLKPGVIA
jgi:hypothetical protein